MNQWAEAASERVVIWRDLMPVKGQQVLDSMFVPFFQRPRGLERHLGWNYVHGAEETWVDGGPFRNVLLLRANVDVIEGGDVAHRYVSAKNAPQEVLQQGRFLWCVAYEDHALPEVQYFTNIDDFRCAMREHCGAGTVDMVGGKTVKERKEIGALQQEGISIKPNRPHDGSSSEGFPAATR